MGQQQTMYGGMYEHFIADYIARTNMTSKSTFIDLGSGIGQFVMQVAAIIKLYSYSTYFRSIYTNLFIYEFIHSFISPYIYPCLLRQVALTLNCTAVGVEIHKERSEASKKLRQAIYKVLGEKACFYDVLFNKVKLENEDMTTFFPAIGKYTHVFFNNYGKWFEGESGKPGINNKFEDALSQNMRAGAQVKSNPILIHILA